MRHAYSNVSGSLCLWERSNWTTGGTYQPKQNLIESLFFSIEATMVGKSVPILDVINRPKDGEVKIRL